MNRLATGRESNFELSLLRTSQQHRVLRAASGIPDSVRAMHIASPYECHKKSNHRLSQGFDR